MNERKEQGNEQNSQFNELFSQLESTDSSHQSFYSGGEGPVYVSHNVVSPQRKLQMISAAGVSGVSEGYKKWGLNTSAGPQHLNVIKMNISFSPKRTKLTDKRSRTN